MNDGNMKSADQIDLGWKTLSMEDSKWIYGFSSLIDYAPDSPSLSDAIGDHYDIYETRHGEFLFKYRIIGQSGFMAPGHVAAEGFFPIPRDLADLLIHRKSDPVVVNKQEVPLDVIVGMFSVWIDDNRDAILCLPEGKDFENDLREMVTCFNASSYRGCLAMAGVVLERSLRYKLSNMGVEIQDDWMVGKMLKTVSDSGEYVDPSLKNVWNIINQQRIVGVHTKETVPIPSADQAAMVLFAVKDLVSRTLSGSDSQHS